MPMLRGWIGVCLLVAIAASQARAIGPSSFETTQRDSSEWPGVAACYPELPAPDVVIMGVYPSPPRIDYEFMIVNWADYPPELFAPAPELPPCGSNEASSRTWVNIYVGGVFSGGNCGVTRSGLSETFVRASVWTCPNVAEVQLYDRECGVIYRSGPIPLLCPTDVASVSWGTIKQLFR